MSRCSTWRRPAHSYSLTHTCLLSTHSHPLTLRSPATQIEDGSVKVLNLEEGGAFTVSSADAILEALE